MSKELHSALIILVMSLVTIGLRALPFGLFGGKRQVPGVVLYLGEVLPSAALGMLVIYCLRDLDFRAAGHGIPDLVSVLAVAAVQAVKRNTILSILAGTVCYMILIHL